ncbi:MAG: hypothetical protein EXS05_04795 [Planctomycetaceae bacterium]|nr:hypothetical protein [Planctomycetaceae bacterium]
MSPQDARDRQIACYRQMTGEQRLKIALDLHEFACDISRAGIRRQFPDADDSEVQRLLCERIKLSRR